MTKAVIWDVGNVIVRWNPRTLYSKIFPDPAECDRFLAQVATMAWHAPTDCGVTFADNIAALSVQHPHYADQIAAWRDRWSEMFSGVIGETQAAIEALHARGVPQYVLSNMSHETYDETVAMSPVFGMMDGLVISGHEAVMKPDPAIFILTCDRYGLTPADSLFVDDSAKNIAAAESVGLKGHHFTDPAALKPALEAFGLL